MGKFAPDATLDVILDYIALCDLMIACSAEPTDYNDAVNVVDLATTAMAGGDYTKADDVSGRKLTMSAKAGVTINHNGSITHVALCRSADTSLRYVTTADTVPPGTPLVAGATVDFPSWKINIADPA